MNKTTSFEHRQTRSRYGHSRWAARNFEEFGFECTHCHFYVSIDSLQSGVQNRNHCPYCLWSRHMDLFEAGDRLCACRAPMQPVGLTIKKTRKKYGPASLGELMLIHRCADCEKISINRIAADDDPDMVYAIYKQSIKAGVQANLHPSGEMIQPLGFAAADMVKNQLFGRR